MFSRHPILQIAVKLLLVPEYPVSIFVSYYKGKSFLIHIFTSYTMKTLQNYLHMQIIIFHYCYCTSYYCTSLYIHSLFKLPSVDHLLCNNHNIYYCTAHYCHIAILPLPDFNDSVKHCYNWL